MKKTVSIKNRLISAVLTLVMFVSSFIGTTFAWFTDEVVSGGNKIQSGNLEVDLSHLYKGEWLSLKENKDHKILNYDKWEPGYTLVDSLKVDNLGSLALKYRLSIEIEPGTAKNGKNGEKLSDVIDVYVTYGDTAADSYSAIKAANSGWTHMGTLTDVLAKPYDFITGQLLPTGSVAPDGAPAHTEVRTQVVRIALHMQESAGNEYQDLSVGDIYVSLLAAQLAYEGDSFGSGYDNGAEWPESSVGKNSIKAPIENLVDGKLSASMYMESADAKTSATFPEGVKAADGATDFVLTLDELAAGEANITLDEGEKAIYLNVHVDGVAEDNEVPIAVYRKEVLPKGLNIGNYRLYHVEDGVTVQMTLRENGATPVHNNFDYDPVTGDATFYLKSFSEVALVAEPAKWEGSRDYSWYKADATELQIANADQLAGLSAIVGGMNGQTQDSFDGKTVKLVADINIGDLDSENGIVFYPIGYWNNEGTYEKLPVEERVNAVSSGFYNFCGTFDGNGHTVSNFYQNTWEMKGDHNWYDPIKEQYYRDGMGLFGKVYGGTVKNLTVKNFSSDGEITTTGVIAAYAEGSTFENIAIFNCNPRVYNIGNGGIVGCVGWYAKEADLKTTFTNITVDNSNKISALWGSYDVACGGIVGQYYPTSGQSSANYPVNAGMHFENCHVSAVMDVYNDVCANYQYYAYRYTGMLIGSVRENETINGHVYPKMDKITAENCTVHFGTWNDYYYCEIIDNTTASYTHDYQMSRLTEIKAINGTSITYLDGTTGTVPASGRANYVIVDYTKGHGTENATCYHFKDGAVWTHDMGGIQTGIDENGDGKDDLKEDKQHIYLEFNNLVTGYGWGVTSKGVGDLDGVTILDRAEGNSVNKFNPVIAEGTSIATESTMKIGELFEAIDNADVDIKADSIQVAVSRFGATSTAGGTYAANTTDWTQGTLTFSGVGQAVISITDYYFCKTTTITVNIIGAEKFDTNFVNYKNYLYRVGNADKSTVALGTIFKHSGKGTINSANVSVEFETIGGNANGTFTANTSDWTKGTIQFTGTGIVKVTINDDTSKEFVLNLEVVDAVNATGATSATSNNVVLLNDAGFGSLEVSNGYTLYGNGFTLTCGSDSAALDMGYAFVTLNNGILDNVQIVCPNFDYAVLYKSNMTESGNRSETTDKTRYFNVKSGVMVSGNSQILNSRISGGRAALYASNGNIVVDNSRLEGGAVATVIISAANSFVFRDVTLVQKPTASTYNSNKTLMGMSVLYLCDANGNATPTTLEGTFVQNAWADNSCTSYMPTGTSSIATTVLGKTEYTHTINNKTCVNLGFAYMPNEGTTVSKPSNITDNRTDKDTIPYEFVDVSASVPVNDLNVNIKTYVYSYKNSNETNSAFTTTDEYVPNKYGDIITVSYSDTADGLEAGKNFGTSGWVYELNVDLDKLSGYALDFSKLSMTINGVPVTDFKVNGSAKPNSPVAVNAGGVTYTLTATVDGKEHTTTYKVTGTETSKESPSKISGPTTAGFGVAKSYGSDWSGAADVLTGVKVKYWSVAENKYIEYDFSNFTVPGNAGKLNGTNNYWEYTHTNNDFTLKVTNTVAIHSSKSVYGMPIRETDGKLYFTISSTNGYVGSGTTSRSITMQYEFTDNNGGELTFTHTFNISYNKDDQYSYSDLSSSGKLTKLSSDSGGGGCVTGDTLITLADGTKKAVRDITSSDMLLVWDFFNGNFATVPAATSINHGTGEWNVITLTFDDGTVIEAVTAHAFFDADLNKFVMITPENIDEYIGHSFTKATEDGTTAVKLVDCTAIKKVTDSYSLVSSLHYNFLVEDIFSLTNLVPDLIAGLEIGEGMKYDEEKLESDIAEYGLYTYDDFADYVTEEQFNAFNGTYLKISVGKGYITYEEIVDLIIRFVI